MKRGIERSEQLKQSEQLTNSGREIVAISVEGYSTYAPGSYFPISPRRKIIAISVGGYPTYGIPSPSERKK